MTPEELKLRTKKFALRVMRMCKSLPKSREADVIARQLLRCGTSVAANYRAACRARSQADFISKITVVEEESDESAFWMELIIEGEILKKSLVSALLQEANELTAIFTASGETAKGNNNPQFKIRNSQSKK
jgi:four helix bundle protein